MDKNIRDHLLNGRDDLLERLNTKVATLEAQLQTLVPIDHGIIPTEPDPGWSPEAIELYEELDRLRSEASRRNSMRCSKQVSVVMKELNSGKPMSPEVRRWWRNRY